MSQLVECPPSLLAVLPGAEAEFARRVISGGIGSFVNFALSNRSRSARGVLARAASDGVLGLPAMDILLGPATMDDDEARLAAVDLVRSLRPKPLLALAALTANQRFTPDDLRQARVLYDIVLAAHGRNVFSQDDRRVYLELLSDSGLDEAFTATFGTLPLADQDWRQVMMLLANLVNPWEGRSAHSDGAAWTRLVSSIFVHDDLEPLDVTSPVGPAFDNILCSSAAAFTDVPLVTVLMPTRNPGRRLSTALASLVNQTWQNLEVLVLDDGSDPRERWYMEAWAERDGRIRILRMPGHVGNYAARNAGLHEASGEYVTVHDDDDWSHPRKIETQVRALSEDVSMVANMSRLVRATDALRFTRINNNPSFIQANYSSLLFRREPVIDGIGYWNEVNRAADAEFRERLTQWSGAPPHVVGESPLSFLRVREGSLTSGEISRGYVDARRRWYQLSSEGWRQDVAAAGGSLYLEGQDWRDRFSIPESMPGAGTDSTIAADIVYATDFRFPGGNTSVSLAEMSALLDAGYRVAAMQLDSPVLGSTRHLTQGIRRLSLHPNCAVVSLADRVTTDIMIVRHPTVMQFAAADRSNITARLAVLIVNHAPTMRDGTSSHYDLPTCLDTMHAILDRSPLVAPESGVIRRCIQGLVDPYRMTPFDWNGILAAPRRGPRSVDPQRPPVVGRHSRDNPEKWPTDRGDLVAAYPVDGSRDVRVLGGADTPRSRLDDRPLRGWTIHPFGSMPSGDFLRDIDFWVYFHAENLIESFGMATAEAMAAGAVVVLPHYMEPTFGVGAVYCDPGQVQEVIDGLWSRPEAYREQSARAIEVAQSAFTEACFLRRIEALGAAFDG